MASFNDCLTADGQRIFALMAQGCKVTFTKVVLGDGIKDDSVSDVDIQNVINPVVTLNIDSVTTSEDNKVTIRTVFQNTQSKPFYMREKGVYATVDGTEECLVFYANNGALAEYVDVAKTQLVEKIIQTVITFSESDNINISLSSNDMIEIVSYLEDTLAEHTENTENPHNVTKYHVGLSDVPNVTTNNQTPTYTEASANAKLSSGEKLSVAMGKIAKAVSSLISHLSNTSNPHSVTKSQVGLGNVPNVATNDQTPTYTVASSNTALASGEKLSVAMGKIAKAVSSLISHLSNKNNPHGVTAEQLSAVKTSDIVDNLTSAATNLPPSARTVKVLNEKISGLTESLGGVRFGTDGDGNVGYYGADDSLIPFKSGKYTYIVKTYVGNTTPILVDNLNLLHVDKINISLFQNNGYVEKLETCTFKINDQIVTPVTTTFFYNGQWGNGDTGIAYGECIIPKELQLENSTLLVSDVAGNNGSTYILSVVFN